MYVCTPQIEFKSWYHLSVNCMCAHCSICTSVCLTLPNKGCIHKPTYVCTYMRTHGSKSISKNYKHCSTKTTIVSNNMGGIISQYGSQIDEAQICSESHNKNIFILDRKRIFEKQSRFIHKSKLIHISYRMPLPTSAFSWRWQKLKITNWTSFWCSY